MRRAVRSSSRTRISATPCARIRLRDAIGASKRMREVFAEVAIHAIAGDDEEVEVVRRIERGAGSAYRVNGRDVRAKDVALLFADAATGAAAALNAPASESARIPGCAKPQKAFAVAFAILAATLAGCGA